MLGFGVPVAFSSSRALLHRRSEDVTCVTRKYRLARTGHPIFVRPTASVSRTQSEPASDSSEGDVGGLVHGTRICIEYCTGCRWGLRASWMATELLTTFSDGEVGEIALRPSSRSGTFCVWLVPEGESGQLVWSRKEAGRFPELKELKQRVRDAIAPEKDLGHSDCVSKKEGG